MLNKEAKFYMNKPFKYLVRDKKNQVIKEL